MDFVYMLLFVGKRSVSFLEEEQKEREEEEKEGK